MTSLVSTLSVKQFLHCHGSGWLLFVDFSKAYDSIDREALLLIMKAHRFHPSATAFVNTALRPYQVKSRIFDLVINVERGVPQGWSLSCVLFNLVIDPLLRSLDVSNNSSMNMVVLWVSQ